MPSLDVGINKDEASLHGLNMELDELLKGLRMKAGLVQSQKVEHYDMTVAVQIQPRVVDGLLNELRMKAGQVQPQKDEERIHKQMQTERKKDEEKKVEEHKADVKPRRSRLRGQSAADEYWKAMDEVQSLHQQRVEHNEHNEKLYISIKAVRAAVWRGEGVFYRMRLKESPPARQWADIHDDEQYIEEGGNYDSLEKGGINIEEGVSNGHEEGGNNGHKEGNHNNHIKEASDLFDIDGDRSADPKERFEYNDNIKEAPDLSDIDGQKQEFKKAPDLPPMANGTGMNGQKKKDIKEAPDLIHNGIKKGSHTDEGRDMNGKGLQKLPAALRDSLAFHMNGQKKEIKEAPDLLHNGSEKGSHIDEGCDTNGKGLQEVPAAPWQRATATRRTATTGSRRARRARA